MKEILKFLKPKEYKNLPLPLTDKLDLTKGKKPKAVFDLQKHLLKVL